MVSPMSVVTLAAVCLSSAVTSASPIPKPPACKDMVNRNELRYDVSDCTGRKVGGKTCQVKVKFWIVR